MSVSYDNRETFGGPFIPSSGVPYVGYVSDSIKNKLPCRPNINDVFKNLLEMVDLINKNLGDNKTLDKQCLTDLNPQLNTQVQINQELIKQICLLKQAINDIDVTIDPNTLMLAVDLLCLIDPSCTPATTYSLQDILVKLIGAYCSLLTRVTTIENILNI